MFAASSLGVNASLALAGDASLAESEIAPAIIASGAAGAMAPPDEWTCTLYVAEYRQFLDAGNDPQSWRFAGKRYRSDADGQVYDWPMWLSWQENAACSGTSAAETNTSPGGTSDVTTGAGGGGFDSMTAVGVVVGLLGLGGLAAAGGGGAGTPPSKSPG